MTDEQNSAVMPSEVFTRERLYQTSAALAYSMYKKFLITDDELRQIDAMLIEKYHPLLGGLNVGKSPKPLDFSALLSD